MHKNLLSEIIGYYIIIQSISHCVSEEKVAKVACAWGGGGGGGGGVAKGDNVSAAYKIICMMLPLNGSSFSLDVISLVPTQLCHYVGNN